MGRSREEIDNAKVKIIVGRRGAGKTAHLASLHLKTGRSVGLPTSSEWNQAARRPVIQKPPGTLLVSIAEIVLSSRQYELNIESEMTEWYNEYIEELAGRNRWYKQLVIRYRHSKAILNAIGVFGPLKWLVGALKGALKAGK